MSGITNEWEEDTISPVSLSTEIIPIATSKQRDAIDVISHYYMDRW